MKVRLLSAVPAAALLACGGGNPPRNDPAPDLSPDITALCQGISNAYDCGRRVEQYQLGRLPQYASRTGDTLFVHLAAGRQTQFVDRNVEDETGVWYAYHAFLTAVGYHLVQVLLYEGTGYQAVGHVNGNVVTVHAPPIVSPDGRRFATASEDLEAGYNPTAIQIWRLAELGAVLEWTLKPGDGPRSADNDPWGPHELRWITPTEIRVEQVRFDVETGVRRVGGEVVIRLTNGEWRVLNEGKIGSWPGSSSPTHSVTRVSSCRTSPTAPRESGSFWRRSIRQPDERNSWRPPSKRERSWNRLPTPWPDNPFLRIDLSGPSAGGGENVTQDTIP